MFLNDVSLCSQFHLFGLTTWHPPVALLSGFTGCGGQLMLWHLCDFYFSTVTIRSLNLMSSLNDGWIHLEVRVCLIGHPVQDVISVRYLWLLDNVPLLLSSLLGYLTLLQWRHSSAPQIGHPCYDFQLWSYSSCHGLFITSAEQVRFCHDFTGICVFVCPFATLHKQMDSHKFINLGKVIHVLYMANGPIVWLDFRSGSDHCIDPESFSTFLYHCEIRSSF